MMSQISRSLAYVIVSIGAALAPSSLLAQMDTPEGQNSEAVRGWSVTSPAPGVHVDSLSKAGPRLVRSTLTAPAVSLPNIAPPLGSNESLGAGGNVALMGVGLAAVLVGSLVGGDGGTIIAISGGVIGFIGLFRYLR